MVKVKILKKLLFAFCFAVVVIPAFSAKYNSIPSLENPVTDKANIIGEKNEAQLNEYLKAVSNQTGVQVAVLTVPNLGGEAIESFSMRVCEAWRLGKKGEDNGVLLTVALDEHKIRIEVGYGLEGVLTDMKCGQIIRNEIAPHFQNESYSSGIKNGVLAIVNLATDGAKIEGEAAENLRTSGGLSSVIIPLIIWFAFFAFIVLNGTGTLPFLLCMMTGRPYHRRPHIHVSGGFGGSSFGDSFGDSGGGFSGGGGSFGGGGASGGW